MSGKKSATLRRDIDRETGTHELLRRIQSSQLDAKQIGMPDRRQLVAYLMGDGYSSAEIAKILKVGDRTIERDKKAIREENALDRDPRLVEEMVGRLVGEAEHCMQRIRKAARDKEASCAVRIDAEHRCYQIVSELIGSLQRLGYLPTAAQKVEAELTHNLRRVPDLATMQDELQRMRQIVADARCLPAEATQELALLDDQIGRAALATRIDALSESIAEGADGELRAEEGGDDDSD